MSTFRKHFRVIWNEGEPVDIVTNAMDVAEAAEKAGGAGMTAFRLVYAALKRHGIDVPSFEEFMDCLDEIQVLSNAGNNDQMGPTVPTAYTAVPLQSAS